MHYLLLLIALNLYAEVTQPNFDFELNQLELFKPGSTKQAIEEKYKNGEDIEEGIRRYGIEHQKFLFPIFVRYENEKVSGYYAKLPTYFLHDVFHQSLINKIGKQDKYFKKENSAVYIWNNKDGFKHIYSASCTITCFPVFYAVFKAEDEQNSLFIKFNSSYK
ncbi:MAG: hypothetical protein ACO2ZP_10845 [Bacteriovoracaceae bacterium]